MICQACGIEAETKHVAFYQNIGALFMRFSRTAEGYMCKSCIHSTFWQFTGITLLVGWFGVISFIVTPFFILNNVFRYLFCLGMAPVRPGATRPELTDEVIHRLQPFTDELIGQLKAGDDLDYVADSIARKAGTTKGQVILYVQALIAASRQS